MWLVNLPVKIDAKLPLSTSAFSIMSNQVSYFLLEGAHIFPSLHFITNVPIGALFVPLDISGHIYFHQGLSFPNLILVWSCSEQFLCIPHTMLPLSTGLHWYFILSRSSLFIHTGLLAFLPDFLFVPYIALELGGNDCQIPSSILGLLFSPRLNPIALYQGDPSRGQNQHYWNPAQWGPCLLSLFP